MQQLGNGWVRNSDGPAYQWIYASPGPDVFI